MNLFKSFGHAMRGLAFLIQSQTNAKIHLVATVCVVMMSFLLMATRTEWCILSIAMALVWMAEGFNTSLEGLADVVSPEHDSRIRDVKDVAAGAVLAASIGAAIVGLLIFIPKLLK